jgi:hypothetical protein
MGGFAGVLRENMVSGPELVARAKIDYPFGPGAQALKSIKTASFEFK